MHCTAQTAPFFMDARGFLLQSLLPFSVLSPPTRLLAPRFVNLCIVCVVLVLVAHPSSPRSRVAERTMCRRRCHRSVGGGWMGWRLASSRRRAAWQRAGRRAASHRVAARRTDVGQTRTAARCQSAPAHMALARRGQADGRTVDGRTDGFVFVASRRAYAHGNTPCPSVRPSSSTTSTTSHPASASTAKQASGLLFKSRTTRAQNINDRSASLAFVDFVSLATILTPTHAQTYSHKQYGRQEGRLIGVYIGLVVESPIVSVALNVDKRDQRSLTSSHLLFSTLRSKVGDIVLAKIKGFPAWPGIVSNQASTQTRAASDR